MGKSLLIVGGGLSGGLLAYRCRTLYPELEIRLIEKGPSLGGNKTWSFHGSDISAQSFEWIKPLIEQSWDYQDVHFPSYRRRLPISYHSISSARFHATVSSALQDRVRFGCSVSKIHGKSVTLSDGSTLNADSVWDARGSSAHEFSPCGYQKFLGLEVLLKDPHGLRGPVLMDATLPQTDGFRFFYLLPWDARRLLIEDTYYSDTPHLSASQVRQEVLAYALDRGWSVEKVIREESGCLPIPLSQMGTRAERSIGTRAGHFHPTTSYSLPFAVRTAELLAPVLSEGKTPSPWLLNPFESRQQKMYLLLNRMLFQAAEPNKRVRVLEHFYRQPQGLIGRFYAGRLNPSDWVRLLLWGKPPVSVLRAAQSLFPRRYAHVGT